MEHRLIIVGAGLAGLTAAAHLARAEPAGPIRPDGILVVDKGRGVGGRLATRRIGGATLDHGAQFFTVRTDPFSTEVERWLAAGVAAEWCRGFSSVDGYPRYRGEGGMKEIARHLGAEVGRLGVEVVTDTRVATITADGDWWRLAYTDGRPDDRSRAVIVTPPVPQTLELLAQARADLDPARLSELEAMRYHRVIGLLTVLDQSPPLPAPGATQAPDDEWFTFVADNRAKGISDRPAVTFHAAHARSAALWDLDDEAVLAELLPAARSRIAPAGIDEVQVKRWRYAGPVAPHPEPCLEIGPGPLVVAGDGFGGSKVEGAFLSGRAAADLVSDRLRST